MKIIFALVLAAAVATSCTTSNPSTPAPSPSPPQAISVKPTPHPEMLLASPTAAGGNKKQTATVVWGAATGWNKPVHYIVGWGLAANNYPNTATTTATTYQAGGLTAGTVYYFGVKTVDSTGLQSPWSQWYHYLVPKGNSPAGPAPVP